MLTLIQEFMPEYPGMEPWKGLRNKIFQDVVKKNLTAAIGELPFTFGMGITTDWLTIQVP